MDKVLSIRGNNQIFSLFTQIQKIQKSANRTEIVNAGIIKALHDNVNWTEISGIKFPNIPIDQMDIPNFIQLRVDADKYNILANQIHDHFHLDKLPPSPYVIKLILTNYLLYLNDIPTQHFPPKPENQVDSLSQLISLEDFESITSLDTKLNHIYKALYKLINIK